MLVERPGRLVGAEPEVAVVEEMSGRLVGAEPDAVFESVPEVLAEALEVSLAPEDFAAAVLEACEESADEESALVIAERLGRPLGWSWAAMREVKRRLRRAVAGIFDESRILKTARSIVFLQSMLASCVLNLHR